MLLEPVGPQTMIDELLRSAPQARPVLDRYGLRGCGGQFGPRETLAFFARAHDVPLPRLLEEIADALRTPTAREAVDLAQEGLADTIYRPFFRGGIAVVLTLGAAWGAYLLARIAASGSFTAAGLHEVNAHGHAQIFGWVGLFVMGFAYQAFSHAYYGAIRHAITVGFVSLMIVGVAAKVVPTLAGIDVHRLPGLWPTFVLLNLGCTIRVVGQILTDFVSPAFPVTGISGVLELSGLAVWAVHLWPMMAARPFPLHLPIPEEAATSAAPIGPESIVAEVVDRNPATLEVFASFGFHPLRNAALRNTIGRRITIRRACAMLGVDIERLLAALNESLSPSFPRS